MVSPIPPINFSTTPATNVTPFTYRDGTTFLDRLEYLKRYIDRELVPWIKKSYGELTEQIETEINGLIAAVNSAIDEVEQFTQEKFDEFEVIVQQIINNSIELQDSVLAGIIGNPTSNTAPALKEFINEQVRKTTAPVVNAESFGVLPGVGNIRQELQAAIAATPDGGTLVIPPSTVPYDFTGTIWSRTGKSITIDAPGVTLRKIDDISDSTAINVGGQDIIRNAATPAPVALSAGQTSINMTAPVTGIEPGDIVLLRSDEFFDDSRSHYETPVYKKGELLTVGAVVGNSIIFAEQDRLRDSYSAGYTLYLDLIKPASVKMSGFRLLTTATTPGYGLVVSCADSVDITGVEVVGYDGMGISVGNAKNVRITGCLVTDCVAPAAGYGISVAGVSGAIITGNTGRRNRHSFDILSSPEGAISRDIIFNANQAISDRSTGISTHSGCEHVTISNNIVSWCGGGITSRGASTTIIGNKVYGYVNYAGESNMSYGGAIVIGDGNGKGRAGENLLIESNVMDFRGVYQTLRTVDGIRIYSAVNNATVIGNHALGMPGSFFYRGSSSSGTDDVMNLKISNNTFIGGRLSSGSGGRTGIIEITPRAGSNAVYRNITIQDNTLTNEDGGAYDNVIFIRGPLENRANSVTVKGNKFGGSTWRVIQMSAGNFNECVVINNEFLSSGDTPTQILLSGDFATAPVTYPNVFAGHGVGRASAGSVPTSGTYRVGHIVWNTYPTPGGVVGWICTTAGTPGTWKTFGAISA